MVVVGGMPGGISPSHLKASILMVFTFGMMFVFVIFQQTVSLQEYIGQAQRTVDGRNPANHHLGCF